MLVTRRTLLVASIAVAALLAAAAGTAIWYFWPLIHAPEARFPPPDWTPTVTVLAGTGAEGQLDGIAISGQFSEPFALASVSDGGLVIADAGSSNAIRRLTASGQLSTIAGGTRGFHDGPAGAAAFDSPSGVAVDPRGEIYVADTGNDAIRRIAADGSVSTVAGDGSPGFQDGPGGTARFNAPIGVALDRRGALLVADSCNDRIRRVEPDGSVRTVAGDGVPGLVDGPAASARFDTPSGVFVSPDGRITVADTGNDVIRRISSNGDVSTVRMVDAAGAPFFLTRPIGLAEYPDGRLYVAEHRGIVEIRQDGVSRFVAGAGNGYLDGPGTLSRFRSPTGVVTTGDGTLIVADSGNRMLRQLAAPGRGDVMPPSMPGLHPGFDVARFGQVPILWPLDPQGGPHEVAGTVGEARGNAGGDGRDRFHAGLDVRGDQGEPVLAVRDGSVEQIIAAGNVGTLNEYVAIGPVTYVHVRVGRDRRDVPLDNGITIFRNEAGKPNRVRVPRGWHVRTGEVIGTVNRFRHVHLTIGPAGEEANALDVGLPNFVDTIPPVIAPRGIEIDGLDDRPITERVHGRLLVRGPVRIVVDAWDRVDGDAPSRRLGVYRLGYQILTEHGEPVPGFEEPLVTITFDRLPGDPDAPHALYAKGSGIPFYRRGRTRFRYNVTTRLEDGRVLDAPWNPAGLAPGNYILRVLVADESGNVALNGRDVALTLP
jgi:sugar lactone lactonase YvrE/murein DD-endopeptidase MepM/ murein hydrolase activator NlpD